MIRYAHLQLPGGIKNLDNPDYELRPDSSAATIYEDCLVVESYTPNFGGALPKGCASVNLTADYKEAILRAYQGWPAGYLRSTVTDDSHTTAGLR